MWIFSKIHRFYPISLHSCHQQSTICDTESKGLQQSCNHPVSPSIDSKRLRDYA